jgi:hypothetical protein
MAYPAWSGFVLAGKPTGTPKPAERTLDTRIGDLATGYPALLPVNCFSI